MKFGSSFIYSKTSAHNFIKIYSNLAFLSHIAGHSVFKLFSRNIFEELASLIVVVAAAATATAMH